MLLFKQQVKSMQTQINVQQEIKLKCKKENRMIKFQAYNELSDTARRSFKVGRWLLTVKILRISSAFQLYVVMLKNVVQPSEGVKHQTFLGHFLSTPDLLEEFQMDFLSNRRTVAQKFLIYRLLHGQISDCVLL